MTMQRLPVELLRRIFVSCLPRQPYLEPNEVEAPLLLMRVCHLWRDLALNTTELWSSLNAIEDDGWGMESMRLERIDGYAVWLSRSGNRPLSLAAPFELDGYYRDKWLNTVLSHTPRLQRLWVVDEEGLDLNVLLNGADRLHILAVEARHDESREVTLAHSHPFLHTLILDGLYARPATLTGPAWANLTHLAVMLPFDESYSADVFLDLISRCPNLQSLIFGGLNTNGFDALPPACSLTHLRSLTIVLDEPLYSDDPSSHILSLPALCSLRVQKDFKRHLQDEVADDENTIAPMLPMLPKRLVLMNVDSQLAFPLFDVHWRNITELEVNFTGRLDVFQCILEACSALETLTLTGRRCDDRCTWLSEPIAHRSLLELDVTVHAPLGNLLCMATLPTLRRLSIAAFDCGQHNDIQAFLTRSLCPLQSLEVHAPASATVWTEEERNELSVLTPTLTELRLQPCSF